MIPLWDTDRVRRQTARVLAFVNGPFRQTLSSVCFGALPDSHAELESMYEDGELNGWLGQDGRAQMARRHSAGLCRAENWAASYCLGISKLNVPTLAIPLPESSRG